MERREFLKSGMLSLTGVCLIPAVPFAVPSTSSGGGHYLLENEYLAWEIGATKDRIASIRLTNKLSGRSYPFTSTPELSFRVAAYEQRIDIPWWYVHIGRDHDNTPPEMEEGFKHGFHTGKDAGDNTWRSTLNLLQYEQGGSTAPPVFDGYVWFRQSFDLPADPKKPITLSLGSYDQQDWKNYWVWINGQQVAHWTNEVRKGRWCDPRTLIFLPGSADYQALRFGGGNLLAVRTYKVDKSCSDIPPEALYRYSFDGRLCDQYLTVGIPFDERSSFEVAESGMVESRNGTTLLCKLKSGIDLEVNLYYQLDGRSRRKWCEIKNVSGREITVLDIALDQLALSGIVNEGDYGSPVILEDGFCAVEHPAGLSQVVDGEIKLRHFPGKKLLPNHTMISKVAVISVTAPAQGRTGFKQYIQERSPRKGLVSIYDPLGIRGLGDNACWVLDDNEMKENIDYIHDLRAYGVSFDYYVPDVGWQDQTGDLKRYWPQCFPDGAKKIVQQVEDAGMKWGLWFSSTWADWSNGQNPAMDPSRTIVPGGKWPPYVYKDGFYENRSDRQFCLASEPYFSEIKNALLWHIREEKLDFFKFDTGLYYCNNPLHEHLPGKYSVEAAYDATIEIAKAVRQVAPGIYIMWYWGIRSPFFALYGDSIFESCLHMEGASTGDFPALFFRDAVTLGVDQGTRLADLIPQRNKDSLGIWMTDISWGNSMRKERWREALVMDLARGNLLFPQIWGNVDYWSKEDLNFLARIQAFAKNNERLLSKPRIDFGDPWKNEVYGYAYSDGSQSIVFINNMDFRPREIELALDSSLGLTIHPGAMSLEAHYPKVEALSIDGKNSFPWGARLRVWLRPFEVALWRFSPQGSFASPKSTRKLESNKSEVESWQLHLSPIETSPQLQAPFGDPSLHPEASPQANDSGSALVEFHKRGYENRFLCFRSTLPPSNLEQNTLAIIVRFIRDGKLWRNQQPAHLIQTIAIVDEERLVEFEAVPSFRQTGNNESTPWIVFRMRTNPEWSGKTLRFGLNAYLPPEVKVEAKCWVVENWWEPVVSV